MFAHNNSDSNLEMEVPLLFPTFEKAKFFIFGAIWIKFESKHFHMFIIDKYDYNL